LHWFALPRYQIAFAITLFYLYRYFRELWLSPQWGFPVIVTILASNFAIGHHLAVTDMLTAPKAQFNSERRSRKRT